MVGDHVVELPGDSLPLLEHCPARSLLALPVHESSLLHEVLRVQPPYPRRIADEPGDEQDEVGLDQALERIGTASADEQHGNDRCRQRREAEGRHAIEALPDGVDRDEDPEPGLQRLSRWDDDDVDDRGRDHDEHHHQRIPAPEDERQAFEEQEPDRQRAGRTKCDGPTKDRQEREHRQPEGDRHVDGTHIDRQSAQGSHARTIPPRSRPGHPSTG